MTSTSRPLRVQLRTTEVCLCALQSTRITPLRTCIIDIRYHDGTLGSGKEKGFVICCHDLYRPNAEMMKQKNRYQIWSDTLMMKQEKSTRIDIGIQTGPTRCQAVLVYPASHIRSLGEATRLLSIFATIVRHT